MLIEDKVAFLAYGFVFPTSNVKKNKHCIGKVGQIQPHLRH